MTCAAFVVVGYAEQMKSKLPRTAKLDATTEGRMVTLLDKLDKSGTGIKFPTVLNLAVKHLLDQLDSGAEIALGENGIRLVKFEVVEATEKKRRPSMFHIEKSEEDSAKKRAAR